MFGPLPDPAAGYGYGSPAVIGDPDGRLAVTVGVLGLLLGVLGALGLVWLLAVFAAGFFAAEFAVDVEFAVDADAVGALEEDEAFGASTGSAFGSAFASAFEAESAFESGVAFGSGVMVPSVSVTGLGDVVLLVAAGVVAGWPGSCPPA